MSALAQPPSPKGPTGYSGGPRAAAKASPSPHRPSPFPSTPVAESKEEGLYRSPISPTTPAGEILSQFSASDGLNLESIFNSTGVQVVQHKFRKALLGTIGWKPRLLTLSADAQRLNLGKRGSVADLRLSADLADDDDCYSIPLAEMVRITSGAETNELQKSLKKREKGNDAKEAAARRCFTIHWRGNNRPAWDLEVDVTPPVVLEGQPATQAKGEALRTTLVDFLNSVAAIGSMSPTKPGADVGVAAAGSSGGSSKAPSEAASPSPARRNSRNSASKGRGGKQQQAADEKGTSFRQRKLSITAGNAEFQDMVSDILKEMEEEDGSNPEDGVLYVAREMNQGRTPVTLANEAGLPFEHKNCGTYSCHGIEPKLTRTGFQVKAKINQDRGGIQFPFGGRPDMAFFCVMDGHGRGGEKISEYCMTSLPQLILAHPALGSNPGKALKESFVAVDDELRRLYAREATYAGTTCVCVLVVGDVMVIANSGDSRAVLGKVDPSSGKLTSKDLSNDHKPDSPSETSRVLSMGGFVSAESEQDGPSRVWLGRAMNSCGLAMARSLGDHALAAVGVIAEPEITTHRIDPATDRYLLLGSDGIWEFISSQQGCEIVHRVVTKDKDGTCDKACRTLIERSSVAWKSHEGDYRDDITGIVVKLPCFDTKVVTPMTPRTMNNVMGTKF